MKDSALLMPTRSIIPFLTLQTSDATTSGGGISARLAIMLPLLDLSDRGTLRLLQDFQEDEKLF